MWKNLQSTEGEIKSESDDLLYYFNKGALSKYKSEIIQYQSIRFKSDQQHY